MIKVPFSFNLDLIDAESLLTNLMLIPCIFLGGYLGILVIHRINQKAFENIITFLAILAAGYLCVSVLI